MFLSTNCEVLMAWYSDHKVNIRQNEMWFIQKLRSEYFPHGANNWLIRASLYSYCKPARNFWRVVRKFLEIWLRINRRPITLPLKFSETLWWVLCKLSVNCEWFLFEWVRYIFCQTLLTIYFSKHAKIQWFLWRCNTALDRAQMNQSYSGFVSSYL